MEPKLDTADKIAMFLGGGLVLFGTAVMGTIEAVLGSPATLPNAEKGVVTTFDPTIRAYFVAAGLLIWALYAGYRLFAAAGGYETPAAPEESPAR